MSRMTRKGQITIPKQMRDYLGLKPGSEVEFTINNDGQFVIRPARPKTTEKDRLEKALEALRGSAGPGMSTDEIIRLTRGWGEDDELK